MHILIAVFCNVLLAVSFYCYRRMRGLKKNYMDVWTTLLLTALAPTIFGINAFLFAYYEMPWGLHEELKDGIIQQVYLEYYVSWCVLFLLMGLATPLIRLTDTSAVINHWSSIRYNRYFDYAVVLLFLGIVFYDLYLIGDLPFFYILSGDILGAEEAKGNFFNSRMKSSIPFLGYLMQYFPLFAMGWAFDRYLNEKKILGLAIVVVISIIYSALTLIKSYALMPVIVCFVIYFSQRNKKMNLWIFFKLSFVILTVVIIPFFLLSMDKGTIIITAVLERIFLVQIQGAFLIRSFYEGMELEALLEGAPLVARLGYETMDPAADVLMKIWGEQAFLDGFVNINSHYIGQGFVMFGPLISLVGPILICLNFILITLLARIFSRSSFSRVARILLITTAALIPINNNFGNTVYLKSFLAFLILLAVLLPIYSLTIGRNPFGMKH